MRRGAFTLLEVLMALVLLACVVVACLPMLNPVDGDDDAAGVVGSLHADEPGDVVGTFGGTIGGDVGGDWVVESVDGGYRVRWVGHPAEDGA